MNNKAFLFVLKLFLFCIIFTLTAVLLCSLFRDEPVNLKALHGVFSTGGTRIVIDPGHGGIDGGAVGKNGVVEKDINLAISKKLYYLLKLQGENAQLTREDDIMLCDDKAPGKKKMQDLRNRVNIAEKDCSSILLSIHLNSFGNPKYSGAQVYYSPNTPESRDIAELMQDSFKNKLQPNNNRKIKKANSSIYLLYHTKVPAVLCECGFLSNPDEAQRLTEEEYQSKIALTIFSSITEYIRTKE